MTRAPSLNLRAAHAATLRGQSGPLLILSHGIGGSPSDWQPLVEALQDRARLLTYAQAGCPQADARLFSASRHASLVGFAEDLSLLCDELGLGGAIYVGHSMAGMAGTLAAIADPGLFRRLILVNASAHYIDDPAAHYRGGFTGEQVEALLAAISNDYAAWASGFGPLMMGNPERPEFGSEFARSLRRLDPSVAAVMFRAAFTSDFRTLMARVESPTLVLQSRDDPAVPLESAQWLAAALPHARYRPLHSRGHFPHVVDPAELIAVLEAELAMEWEA